ncbi:MAG: hypothetical protein ABW021_11255 [Acidimicrobiia bacterium]|jgi:hypothetical protein
MPRISRSGITVDVPDAWEGTISGGDFQLESDGAVEPTVMHVASFPLPAERGSFGTGAVELMSTSDVFMTLFEYGPESAGTPLFEAEGIPRQFAAREFDRNALQRAMPGQTGLQRFFTHEGRAFCLYIVLGSHVDRADILPRVNAVLETLEIG